MPAIQSSEVVSGPCTSPPCVSARIESTVAVTGWCSANARSQLGIVAVGANVELAKTSGKIGRNPATCAVSGSPTSMPISANIHENAKPKRIASSTAAIALPRPLWKRKPTSVPTPTISRTTKKLRVMSASVRPASTAERAIGSERKRSIIPVRRSAASPTAV